jgi:hypothetical protein
MRDGKVLRDRLDQETGERQVKRLGAVKLMEVVMDKNWD